jgi:hypothetical protein
MKVFNMRYVKRRATSPLTVKLDDGFAENMGGGVFVILQDLEDVPQQVVIDLDDVATLTAFMSERLLISEGVAIYMGSDLWTIRQTDEFGRSHIAAISQDDLVKIWNSSGNGVPMEVAAASLIAAGDALRASVGIAHK